MNEQTQTVAPSSDVIERMWDFANKIAGAKFLPPEIRGDVASVFYLLATANDMNMPWTFLARTAFPGEDGGLGIKGEVVLSALLQRGFGVDVTYTEEPIGCTCTITRPDGPAGSRTFTMEDAARIETRWLPAEERWEKLAENYFYRNYPKEMCTWRALTMCARVVAPDVISGAYLPDELARSVRDLHGNGKPAEQAETFEVAEKEEVPAEPEAASNVAEKREVEAKPAPEPEPEPEPEPDPGKPEPLAEQGEAPQPQVVTYEIWGIMPDAQPAQVAGVAPFTDIKQATAKAVALANERGFTTLVVQADGKVRKEVSRHRPAEPAADKPAAQQQPSFDDLLQKVVAAIGGKGREAKKTAARFLAGYFGVTVKALPAKDKMVEALQVLLPVLDDRVEALRTKPEDLGEELAGRKQPDPLDAEFDRLGWPDHIRMLAGKARDFRKQTPEQFITWINHPMIDDVSIASMDVEALEVFWPLFLLVKGRAWEPIDLAVARGWPVTKTMQDLVTAAGQPVEQWTAEFAAKALDMMRKVATEEQPTAPEPEAAPPADDEWATAGLPFGD